MKFDNELLSALLSENDTKEMFFKELNEMLVLTNKISCGF